MSDQIVTARATADDAKHSALTEINIGEIDTFSHIYFGNIEASMRRGGMFLPLDAATYYSVLCAQFIFKVTGNIAEIGVFAGSTFSAMLFATRQQEVGVAIDVFDMYKHPPCFDPNIFRTTMNNFQFDESKYKMIFADTRKPEYHPIIDATLAGGCRFFHVDGDHRMANVRQDSEIACRAVANVEGAVIVFDDTMDRGCPEVTEGVFDFLARHPEFSIFAMTEKKMYLCRESFREKYGAIVLHMNTHNIESNSRHIRGRPYLGLANKDQVRIMNFNLENIQAIIAHIESRQPVFTYMPPELQ